MRAFIVPNMDEENEQLQICNKSRQKLIESKQLGSCVSVTHEGTENLISFYRETIPI